MMVQLVGHTLAVWATLVHGGRRAHAHRLPTRTTSSSVLVTSIRRPGSTAGVATPSAA